MMGITGVTWNHLATPECLGRVAILDLSMHMMIDTFSLLEDMCLESQLWISIVQYIFIENKGTQHMGEQ